jgi:hypothetical protein
LIAFSESPSSIAWLENTNLGLIAFSESPSQIAWLENAQVLDAAPASRHKRRFMLNPRAGLACAPLCLDLRHVSPLRHYWQGCSDG